MQGIAAARTQETHRLKLTVAYDGSDFAGFQWQAGKIRTVQGELEKAVSRVLMPASRCVGASRTDGGAHALGQVVHLDVHGSRESLQPESLQLYLNGVLPPDVKVQALELAPEGFDAHFSSCGKEYHYLLSCGPPSPGAARARWWVHDRWCEMSRGKPQGMRDIELDVGAMQEAAALLQASGIHDYSAFMDKKRPSGLGRLKRKKPHLVEKGIRPERTPDKNLRHLWKLDVLREPDAAWPPLAPGAGGGHVRIEVAGNGFLYRMVRMLVTALVEVGHRRLTPAQAASILESGDRGRLPEAAPPQGLYLMQVLYELPDGVEPLLRGRRGRGGGEEGGGESGGGGGAEDDDGEE
ncbi:MAG: pseudouridine synthase [Monoraphidium minutum]|nr:MAG: pseudouridine synthase [Monoraphidium minutum]